MAQNIETINCFPYGYKIGFTNLKIVYTTFNGTIAPPTIYSPSMYPRNAGRLQHNKFDGYATTSMEPSRYRRCIFLLTGRNRYALSRNVPQNGNSRVNIELVRAHSYSDT